MYKKKGCSKEQPFAIKQIRLIQELNESQAHIVPMWFYRKAKFLPAFDRQASLLISNAELQSKNVELGIRVPTQMVLQEDLGTWYLVLCTKYQVQKKGLPGRAALF